MILETKPDGYFEHKRNEMLSFIDIPVAKCLDLGCGRGGYLDLLKIYWEEGADYLLNEHYISPKGFNPPSQKVEPTDKRIVKEFEITIPLAQIRLKKITMIKNDV